ncbi:MATE family efflux transporter [Bifidobacterium avesanii]|uniref:MATE family efflux transporter n=1 Tax=Bifidobacterium avesanii TaxID=1798157 RepID=A0A7K3TII1_9BIFI|nr:MATE family efflux transporter [Bifidobacterium avesanii]KAB8290957.1 MATE family efflux transporter [Bifidobacterium avesanii]NEG78915.1 MATE family efflux transporter [Bifidobacterium avesanii]
MNTQQHPQRRSANTDQSANTDRSDDANRPANTGQSANVNRRILALALPTFGQLIAEPTFILIDTAIVGHISDAALAGLSIGSTIILTAVGLCIFLAYSTTAQVAHLLGAGRRREGMQAGVDGLWLALGIGVALGVALFAAADPLCRALGGRGEVLGQAVTYTRAIVLGAPGMLLVYAANGIFRGVQKVRVTLIAAVSGAVLNTVLEVLFVLVFRWGIAGSGAATLIAQWYMGLFLAVPAILWAKADGASLKPQLAGIARAGGDGLPLFIRTLAIRAAMVVTVASAARMGTDVLAGFQAVNSSWNFAMNMLDSVGIAGQTLVGTALGARAVAETRRLTRATGRAGLVTGAAIGVGFAVVGLFAGRFFSPSPAIQLLVAAGMLTMGVFFPLQGWMMALDGILIGARDYRYLAVTCTLTAVAYIALMLALADGLTPLMPSEAASTVALWTLFNVVLMGGRGLANGLRVRGDRWMR